MGAESAHHLSEKGDKPSDAADHHSAASFLASSQPLASTAASSFDTGGVGQASASAADPDATGLGAAGDELGGAGSQATGGGGAASGEGEEEDEEEEANRYNCASSQNGAKIVSSNKGSVHASALLSDDPDSYFNSPCAADKWVVVQLSHETVVRAVWLVNYEFYSSTVRRFELLGSHKSPRSGCVAPPPDLFRPRLFPDEGARGDTPGDRRWMREHATG